MVGDEEPSDAETLDSESSGDETDDVDSDTERTTESEEQVVPRSERESSSREAASENESPNEVTTSNVSVVTNPAIKTLSSSTERGPKIDLVLYSRLLKQTAAKSAKPVAKGAVHSHPVLAKPVRVEKSSALVDSNVSQSLRVNSSTGGLHQAVSSVGNCPIDCFRKPADMSRRRDSGIPAVRGPQMKSFVQHSTPQMNNTWLTAGSSTASRCIAPTYCGSGGMSASKANDPALSAVVKAEPPDHVLNQTYAVADTGGELQSGRSLHNETFCLPSLNKRCEPNHSVAVARPNVSESSVITDVNKHHQPIDNKTPFNETFVTASLVKPITSIKPASGAVVPAASQHDVSRPAFNKPCQSGSSDSTKQACSQIQCVASQQGITTAMSDIATTTAGPADFNAWHSGSMIKHMYVVEPSPRRQRTALTPQRGGIAFLDRSVIASVSADTVCDLPRVENHDSLTSACFNQTADVSSSKPSLCKAAGSTKVVKSASQPLLPDHGTFIVEEPSVSAVTESMLASPRVSRPNPVSLTVCGASTGGQQSGTFTTCSDQHAPTTSATFEVSGRESRQSDFVNLCCNDTNNSRATGAYTSDVGLKCETADGGVDRKPSRRRCQGFAASSPLRGDSSPPPCDVSFCSLSTISWASDWEDYDASDESETDSMCFDNTDEVILLDTSFTSDQSLNVAFVSDDQSPLSKLAAGANTVSVTDTLRTETPSTIHSDVSCQLLSSAKLSEVRPLSTKNCSGTSCLSLRDSVTDTGHSELPNDAGPTVCELRSKQTRKEVLSAASHSTDTVTSHKTESGSSVGQNSKSPKFLPLSTSSSSSKSHFTRVLNSRDRVKTRCYEPSRPVVSKRTRGRVLSSSSSDGEDATFIKQNSRFPRNTRIRLV